MIKRIRIPASWRLNDNSAGVNVAEFNLGIGPCGKTVELLDVQYLVQGVLITQHCTCKERKEFLYPWHTVTGRVEVTYE